MEPHQHNWELVAWQTWQCSACYWTMRQPHPPPVVLERPVYSNRVGIWRARAILAAGNTFWAAGWAAGIAWAALKTRMDMRFPK